MSVMERAGSPNWFIEFTHRGRTVRKTSGVPLSRPKREALKIEQTWRDEIDEEIATGRTKATLEAALKRYHDVVVKAARKEDFKKVAKRLMDGLGADTLLDDLTAAKITSWAEGLLTGGRMTQKAGGKQGEQSVSSSSGLKPGSINSYLRALHAVLVRSASAKWNMLKTMPEFDMLEDDAKKLRYLEPEEARALLAAAVPDYRSPCPSLRLQQLLRTLLGCGGRLTEVMTLTWTARSVARAGWVDLAQNGAAYVHFLTTKTDKPRRVPIGEGLRTMLLEMRRQQLADGYTGNHVFAFFDRRDNTWKELKDVSSSFKRARKQAGLGRDVTLHTMRHTYASWLVQDDVPLKKVSELLGHTSISTTEIYAHLAPVHLESSVAKLESRLEQAAA